MTDPLHATDEPLGADTGAGVRALLALLRAGGDPSSLLTWIAQAPLSTEQRGLFELFQALHGGDDDHDAHRDDAHGDDDGEDYRDDVDDASARGDAGDFRRDQELADLREVNDTVAAALGACRACWGGDLHCPLCGGRGRAGSAPPDPRLFEALVIPAVRRVRAQAHRSPTTEASR